MVVPLIGAGLSHRQLSENWGPPHKFHFCQSRSGLFAMLRLPLLCRPIGSHRGDMGLSLPGLGLLLLELVDEVAKLWIGNVKPDSNGGAAHHFFRVCGASEGDGALTMADHQLRHELSPLSREWALKFGAGLGGVRKPCPAAEHDIDSRFNDRVFHSSGESLIEGAPGVLLDSLVNCRGGLLGRRLNLVDVPIGASTVSGSLCEFLRSIGWAHASGRFGRATFFL